jgi:hypothetical protein
VASLALEHRMLAPGRDPHRNEAIAWSIGWLALGRHRLPLHTINPFDPDERRNRC